MISKQDRFYFDTFIVCAEQACEAAVFLCDGIKDRESGKTCFSEISKPLEHNKARECFELLCSRLEKAFVTPIDRADIFMLCKSLVDMHDSAHRSAMLIYCLKPKAKRHPMSKEARCLVECYNEIMRLMKEFTAFKTSKKLGGILKNISIQCDEFDCLYRQSLSKAGDFCTSSEEMMKYTEILKSLKSCRDSCKNTAELVYLSVIRNT